MAEGARLFRQSLESRETFLEFIQGFSRHENPPWDDAEAVQSVMRAMSGLLQNFRNSAEAGFLPTLSEIFRQLSEEERGGPAFTRFYFALRFGCEYETESHNRMRRWVPEWFPSSFPPPLHGPPEVQPGLAFAGMFFNPERAAAVAGVQYDGPNAQGAMRIWLNINHIIDPLMRDIAAIVDPVADLPNPRNADQGVPNVAVPGAAGPQADRPQEQAGGARQDEPANEDDDWDMAQDLADIAGLGQRDRLRATSRIIAAARRHQAEVNSVMAGERRAAIIRRLEQEREASAIAADENIQRVRELERQRLQRSLEPPTPEEAENIHQRRVRDLNRGRRLPRNFRRLDEMTRGDLVQARNGCDKAAEKILKTVKGNANDLKGHKRDKYFMHVDLMRCYKDEIERRDALDPENDEEGSHAEESLPKRSLTARLKDKADRMKSAMPFRKRNEGGDEAGGVLASETEPVVGEAEVATVTPNPTANPPPDQNLSTTTTAVNSGDNFICGNPNCRRVYSADQAANYRTHIRLCMPTALDLARAHEPEQAERSRPRGRSPPNRGQMSMRGGALSESWIDESPSPVELYHSALEFDELQRQPTRVSRPMERLSMRGGALSESWVDESPSSEELYRSALEFDELQVQPARVSRQKEKLSMRGGALSESWIDESPSSEERYRTALQSVEHQVQPTRISRQNEKLSMRGGPSWEESLIDLSESPSDDANNVDIGYNARLLMGFEDRHPTLQPEQPAIRRQRNEFTSPKRNNRDFGGDQTPAGEDENPKSMFSPYQPGSPDSAWSATSPYRHEDRTSAAATKNHRAQRVEIDPFADLEQYSHSRRALDKSNVASKGEKWTKKLKSMVGLNRKKDAEEDYKQLGMQNRMTPSAKDMGALDNSAPIFLNGSDRDGDEEMNHRDKNVAKRLKADKKRAKTQAKHDKKARKALKKEIKKMAKIRAKEDKKAAKLQAQQERFAKNEAKKLAKKFAAEFPNHEVATSLDSESTTDYSEIQFPVPGDPDYMTHGHRLIPSQDQAERRAARHAAKVQRMAKEDQEAQGISGMAAALAQSDLYDRVSDWEDGQSERFSRHSAPQPQQQTVRTPKAGRIDVNPFTAEIGVYGAADASDFSLSGAPSESDTSEESSELDTSSASSSGERDYVRRGARQRKFSPPPSVSRVTRPQARGPMEELYGGTHKEAAGERLVSHDGRTYRSVSTYDPDEADDENEGEGVYQRGFKPDDHKQRGSRRPRARGESAASGYSQKPPPRKLKKRRSNASLCSVSTSASRQSSRARSGSRSRRTAVDSRSRTQVSSRAAPGSHESRRPDASRNVSTSNNVSGESRSRQASSSHAAPRSGSRTPLNTRGGAAPSSSRNTPYSGSHHGPALPPTPPRREVVNTPYLGDQCRPSERDEDDFSMERGPFAGKNNYATHYLTRANAKIDAAKAAAVEEFSKFRRKKGDNNKETGAKNDIFEGVDMNPTAYRPELDDYGGELLLDATELYRSPTYK